MRDIIYSCNIFKVYYLCLFSNRKIITEIDACAAKYKEHYNCFYIPIGVSIVPFPLRNFYENSLLMS